MFVDIPVSFEGYDDYCGVGSVSMVMRYFEQEFLSKQVAPLIILRYLVSRGYFEAHVWGGSRKHSVQRTTAC